MMHDGGMQLVNTTSMFTSIQLQIKRKTKGSGNIKYHVFVISDSQFNIKDRQLESGAFEI